MSKWRFTIEIELSRDPTDAGEAQNLCAGIEEAISTGWEEGLAGSEIDIEAEQIVCLQPAKV